MFFYKELLYKGPSLERYNEIRNILELNNIKYKLRIENKNKDIGPMADKMIIGTLGQKEDFSNVYIILVNKKDYEYASYLIKNKN